MPTVAPPVRVAATFLASLLGACLTVPADAPPGGLATVAPEAPKTSEAAAVSVPDPFPSAAELEQISTRPRPDPATLLGTSVAPVEAWTLHGPGASLTAVAHYRGEDPNARALDTVLAKGADQRRVTEAMQCVAEEFGHFVLTHGDEPAADIRSFIAARCGSPVVWPRVTVRRMPSEELPRRPLHAVKDRQILDSMAAGIPAKAGAGLFVGRSEHEGVIALAYGVPDIELEPVPLVLEGRREVDIRGRMQWDYDHLSGYATRGELGSLPCRPLTREPITAPQFALRCPLSADDEATVIELHASPRGRLLGRRVLRVLVSAHATAPNHYQSPQLSLPIGPDEHDGIALATAINALRRKAGMSPVSASAGQSEVLADLLPHFLETTGDPTQTELADQIALGMMAGRRVEAEIRWGSFFTSNGPSNWSLERDLAAELSSPYSRSRLFDPEATTVAYAELSLPSHAMRRSVIATYSELRERDYTAEVVALFDAIDRQRVASGLEPIVRAQGAHDVRTMNAVAHRVRDGEQTPNEALQQLVEHFAAQTGTSVHGLIMLPSALDGWIPELEGPLVSAPRVTAAIAISHFRPSGAAWGRNLVLVVFTEL